MKPGERILAVLAYALVAVACGWVVFALAAPIVSGDLFWHLSCGRWTIEHGHLLGLDPFSHTASDKPAELQEYGSQIVLALVERFGGLDGLRVFGVVLGAALVALVYTTARRRVPTATAAALTALFVALFAYKWELRPQLFSAFVLLRLAQLLFERAPGIDPAPTRRATIECALWCVVWVQLHAESLFGPIFALTGLIGASCAWLFERHDPDPRRTRRIGVWLLAFAALVCATLVSPLGLEPHLYVLRDSSVAQSFIEEWQPIWVMPNDPRAFPLTVAFQVLVWTSALVSVAVLVWHALALLEDRPADGRRPHWERFGFLCLCVVLAFVARRYFWLLWFVLLDAVAFWHTRRTAVSAVRERLSTVVELALGALVLIPTASTLVFMAVRQSAREGRFAESVDSALFPVHAARFVREAGLDGNLYHPYSWGGYLGHELWPANKVFVDGRTILFADVIPERFRAERDLDFARTVFAQRGVDVIVFQRLVDHGAGAFLWRPPDADETWLRVWCDRIATVWVRRARSELVERAATWFAQAGIELDRERGFDEYSTLEAQPAWLESRALLAPQVAARVAGPLARIGPGVSGASAWIELGEIARQSAMERAARRAYLRAVEALRGAADRAASDSYTRLGPLRAFAALRDEIDAITRGARPGAR